MGWDWEHCRMRNLLADGCDGMWGPSRREPRPASGRTSFPSTPSRAAGSATQVQPVLGAAPGTVAPGGGFQRSLSASFHLKAGNLPPPSLALLHPGPQPQGLCSEKIRQPGPSLHLCYTHPCHTCMHARTRAHTHTGVQADAHTEAHACAHGTHTCTHIRTCTCTHTGTHVHT